MPQKKASSKQLTLNGDPFVVTPNPQEGCVDFVAGPYAGRVTVGPDKKAVVSVRKGMDSFNETAWSATGYNGKISFHATKLTSYGRSFDAEVFLKDGVPYPQFVNTSVPSLRELVHELRNARIPLDENGCMGMEKTLTVLTELEIRRIRLPKHLAHNSIVSQLEERFRSVVKHTNALEEAARLEKDVEVIKEKQPDIVALIKRSTVPNIR